MIPRDEAQRMQAVRRYDILDTPPDGAFDRITAMAARRFDVPISIISVVDHDRIWFKSHHGLAVEQIDRDPGLCASAILSTEPYILGDAKTDLRSLANPLVAGEFGLRFYAAVPLTTSDGHNLGTLCVIDRTPRLVDQRQIDDLKDLASVVMDQMELRLSARQALSHSRLMAREVDHRVMNSLQFVSSLLHLQSLDLNSIEAANALRLAANRVSAVACVHRNFYSHEASEVSCIAFLQRLVGDLSRIVGKPIEVKGDEGNVPTTWIQPIGLIVNELVTNAAKHGTGQIEVDYRRTGTAHVLAVTNEGPSLPLDFDPLQSGGLGMKVVAGLVTQLGAVLRAGPNPSGGGCRVTVTFATS